MKPNHANQRSTIPLKMNFLRGFGYLMLGLSFMLFSCEKREELYAFKGTVTDIHDQPVAHAKIQVFHTSNDWLTGLNEVARFQSDLSGRYASRKIYESGSYFLFIEKYDSSNWEYREVERGVYPTVTLPIAGYPTQIIQHNSMSLLANTQWKISNVLLEYSVSGSAIKEWRSTWAETNNCKKDNTLHFGKDLSMRIGEGNLVCLGKSQNILGSFVPPLIFTHWSCEKLLHTSQKVKNFEYANWPEMETKNGQMYLACNRSVGQLYVICKESPECKKLYVYSVF